jgi:hypothetical protein
MEPEESEAFASLVYFHNRRHDVRYSGRILCAHRRCLRLQPFSPPSSWAETPVFIRQEAGWTTEPIIKQWRQKIFSDVTWYSMVMNTYLPSCMASNPILNAMRTTYPIVKFPLVSEIEHRSYRLYGLKEEWNMLKLSIMPNNAISHYRTDLKKYSNWLSWFIFVLSSGISGEKPWNTRKIRQEISLTSIFYRVIWNYIFYERSRPSVRTDVRLFAVDYRASTPALYCFVLSKR